MKRKNTHASILTDCWRCVSRLFFALWFLFVIPGWISSGPVRLQEHRVKAQQLAKNNALLERKLSDKLFLDACFLSGIEPQDLRDRPYESFRTEPNRARALSYEEQKLRYKDFQDHRMELLEVVVAEEERSYVQQTKLEAEQERELKKLQREFSQSLRLEQQQVDRMVKNRQKYERVLEVENRRIHKQRALSAKRGASVQQKVCLVCCDVV